jgi:hypothetical protein
MPTATSTATQRIAELEADVAQLRAELDELRRQLAVEVRTARIVVGDESALHVDVTPGSVAVAHELAGNHASLYVTDVYAECAVSAGDLPPALKPTTVAMGATTAMDWEPFGPGTWLCVDGRDVATSGGLTESARCHEPASA